VSFNTTGTATLATLSPGERWAYRARQQDPLVEVVVRKLGSGKPARVLVGFVAEHFEGREEWVPPSRLKTPWTDVVAFTAREQRWNAVAAASDVEEPVEFALSTVFDQLIDRSLATLEYRLRGVAYLHDIEGLATEVGLSPNQLCADPLAFTEDDDLIVPVSITELIARTAAARTPEPVLREVQREEAEFARLLVHGKTYPASRSQPAWHVPAERYADSENEPYHRPCWELLRAWCGAEAAERQDELLALRQEVARIGDLALRAVAALRAAGRRREADQLEQELGVPVGGT